MELTKNANSDRRDETNRRDVPITPRGKLRINIMAKIPVTDVAQSSFQRETDAVLSARLSALELIVSDLCKHLGRDPPLPSVGTEWLLIKQAAGKIGYSQSGVRNLMRRRKIEFIKTKAGRILIKGASLPEKSTISQQERQR
jgi:hypothetical protein